MKHYCIATLDVTDPDWTAAYVEKVTPMVERHGGRYLARTPKVDKLEGDRETPQLALVIEWPSRESAIAFYESEEYAPFLESRRRGSRSEMLLVAGEDFARPSAG